MKVVGEKNKHKHSFKIFLTNFKINFQADGLRNQFKLFNSPCKNEIITKKKKKERQAEDFGKLCAESLQQTAGRTAGL